MQPNNDFDGLPYFPSFFLPKNQIFKVACKLWYVTNIDKITFVWCFEGLRALDIFPTLGTIYTSRCKHLQIHTTPGLQQLIPAAS